MVNYQTILNPNTIYGQPQWTHLDQIGLGGWQSAEVSRLLSLSLSFPPSLPPFMKGIMGWVAFENAGPYPGQPLPSLPQTCYARVCPVSLFRLVWATLVSITCLGFLLLDWENSLDNLFWLNRASGFLSINSSPAIY